MKYLYIYPFFLVFMLALTSCGKEELTGDTPITLSSLAKGAFSRAPMVDSEDDTDFNDFVVWGNYDGTEVFTNQLVTRSGSEWTYAPPQYWVTTATLYDFTAYSPQGAGIPQVTNNQLISLDFDSKAKQVDLMMASATVGSEEFGKPVDLPFEHALAAVQFTFQLKEGFSYANTYTFDQIQVGNVYTQGTFALGDNSAISLTLTGNKGETNTIGLSEPMFVIPQAGSAQFMIKIYCNDTPMEIHKNDVAIHWEAGKLYTYHLVIDPLQDITITVETTDWERPTIDHIVVGGGSK